MIRLDVTDIYETIEEWARQGGNQTLIRDKTALAILTLCEVIHQKDQPVELDGILEGAITGTIDMSNGVRKDA